jgi:amino acid transporter
MAITTGNIGVSSVPDESAGKGLKVGALGFISSLVIGVASTAPAYSLAATLGFVAAYVGVQSPAVMLLAFVPMLFIAAAYYYLNRADPDCGTTFTWVTRAIGPKTGWLAGWGILVTDLVVMPNLASIAGGDLAHHHDGHLLHRDRAVGPHPGGPARRRDRHPLGLFHRGPGQGVQRASGPQHPAHHQLAEPL